MTSTDKHLDVHKAKVVAYIRTHYSQQSAARISEMLAARSSASGGSGGSGSGSDQRGAGMEPPLPAPDANEKNPVEEHGWQEEPFNSRVQPDDVHEFEDHLQPSVSTVAGAVAGALELPPLAMALDAALTWGQ